MLAVTDRRGWMPDWLPLVVAVVVVVSLWVSIAMAVIMINRREHMWLLQAMLPKKVRDGGDDGGMGATNTQSTGARYTGMLFCPAVGSGQHLGERGSIVLSIVRCWFDT